MPSKQAKDAKGHIKVKEMCGEICREMLGRGHICSTLGGKICVQAWWIKGCASAMVVSVGKKSLTKAADMIDCLKLLWLNLEACICSYIQILTCSGFPWRSLKRDFQWERTRTNNFGCSITSIIFYIYQGEPHNPGQW